MRTCYDSTNPNDIPTTARMVAYYVDGIYAVSQATVRARFPTATLVPISAVGTNDGVVGDVEPGCMDPQYAVGWVQRRRAAGIDPTIYCNELHGWTDLHGGYGPVRLAFLQVGVPEPHYWTANYSRPASVLNGTIAHQYANPTLTGGHYDLSVVLDFWPGVDNTFGPGGSTIGGRFGTMTDDEITRQFNFLSEKLSTIGGALQAELAAIKVEVDTLKAAGGTTAPQPKTLTGTITGTITGTLT